jgi:hypothetical protein
MCAMHRTYVAARHRHRQNVRTVVNDCGNLSGVLGLWARNNINTVLARSSIGDVRDP